MKTIMLTEIANNYTPTDIHTGLSAEFDRQVSVEEIARFAECSGDFNPLHVDSEYALHSSFGRPIAHGVYQASLASAMVGMHLPGRHALLASMNARFLQPLFFPTTVRVRGEVIGWRPDQLSGNLKVTVEELERHVRTAEFLVGFTFHEESLRPTSPAPLVETVKPIRKDLPLVMVTGASGALGSAITETLADQYNVIATTRSRNLRPDLSAQNNVRSSSLDLQSPDWEEGLHDELSDQPLYAIVHAAWPSAPTGGLLGASDAALEQQILCGTTQLIRLARLLNNHVPATGGRLITLTPLLASQKQRMTQAPYALGKAALTQTMQLLAPELARKQITINAICASAAGAGLHAFANETIRLKEAALAPLGRLCTTDDITSTIRFLLSPQASFISGQTLGVTGAQG